MEKDGNNKKAKAALLISDKIDFKTKSITKDKALYNNKKINSRRDIILVNIDAPNTEPPICIK